jgi:nucleotide-binding universal stress UspA family protein
MKPILLATDGSPSAEAATQEAIEFAHTLDAPLIVVCVSHPELPAYGGYYGYGAIAADLIAAETETVDRVLAETKQRAQAAGVDCETLGVDGLAGLAAEQICGAADERHARLIVIGAHGWGPVGRLLHGSVSTHVLRHATCPVLVVTGDARAKTQENVPSVRGSHSRATTSAIDAQTNQG